MSETQKTLRLYDDLVWLWPMWGRSEEYADYCAHVVRLIREHSQIPVRSLLNVGCGGGKNAFNLKDHFEVTGLDISPRMLAIAEELNPGCEFLEGDLRNFSLGKTFDAVLIDDAVSYMTTEADLRSAFVASWRHLNPGGVMVVGPDQTRETFIQNRTEATRAIGKKELRNVEVVFIQNDYDPDPTDDQYEATMIYLIRQGGRLRVETDHHILGLFSLDVWRETLLGVGFTIHQEEYLYDGNEYVTFACFKPR